MGDPASIQPLIPRPRLGSGFTVTPPVDRLIRDQGYETAGSLGRDLWLALECLPAGATVGEWIQLAVREEAPALAPMVRHQGASPVLWAGRALCIGLASYGSALFQGAVESLQAADYNGPRNARQLAQYIGLGLEERGFEVHTLVDQQATQGAILERLEALLEDHDPVHPFILWCSGLGFGSGEATRLLAWDAPLSDPGQGTLSLGFLKALLMKVPHWVLVLDAAWPVPRARALGRKVRPDNPRPEVRSS